MTSVSGRRVRCPSAYFRRDTADLANRRFRFSLVDGREAVMIAPANLAAVGLINHILLQNLTKNFRQKCSTKTFKPNFRQILDSYLFNGSFWSDETIKLRKSLSSPGQPITSVEAFRGVFLNWVTRAAMSIFLSSWKMVILYVQIEHAPYNLYLNGNTL